MITISDQSARLTFVNSHRERLANFCSAQTGLRCSARVNSHKHASGAFSLVRKHKQKVRPRGIIDGLRKPAASESLDIQILNGYQPIVVDDLPRSLVVEISPLIADMVIEPSKKQCGLAPAIRTLLTTRYAPLKLSEFSLRGSKPAGILNRLSGAQRGEGIKPYVDPDDIRIERQRLWFNFDAEESKPSSGLSLNGQRFNGSFELTVKPDLDGPDFRYSQPSTNERFSDLAKCHAVVVPTRSESWVSRLFSGLHSAKERIKSEMNSLQHVLQNVCINLSNVRSRFPDFRKLKVLIKPANRFAFSLPCVTSLKEGGIVKFSAYREVFVKDGRLAFGWINTVSERLDHWRHCNQWIFV